MKLFPYDTNKKVYLFDEKLFREPVTNAWRNYRLGSISKKRYKQFLNRAIEHPTTVDTGITAIGSTVSIDDYIVIYTHPYLYVLDGNTGRLLKKV